jgi:hypothetical protein
MATLEEFRQKFGGMSKDKVSKFNQSFHGAFNVPSTAHLEDHELREWLARMGVLREREGYFCLNLGLATESQKLDQATIATARANQIVAAAAVEAARRTRNSVLISLLALAVSIIALLK